jgi:membrane protein implicated in regulation of membrane protease activity
MWRILKVLLKAFDIICSTVYIVALLAAVIGVVVWAIMHFPMILIALLCLLVAGLIVQATEKGKKYVARKELENKQKSGK